MTTIASQITSLAVVFSIVYSDADQRKHQSSASLAFVWGIHRGPVNSPHKGPVTRKMFQFDDVIMVCQFTRFHDAVAMQELTLLIPQVTHLKLGGWWLISDKDFKDAGQQFLSKKFHDFIVKYDVK